MVDYSVIFGLGIASAVSICRNGIQKQILHIGAVGLCLFNWLLMVRYFTHGLPEYGYVSAYDLYIGTLWYPIQFVLKVIY